MTTGPPTVLAGRSTVAAGRMGLALPAAVLTMMVLLLTVAGPARALGGPAADCQPFTARPCLLPFPDNRFTRPDRTTATGLRVHLPAAAMPVGPRSGSIRTGPFDHNDGFSPGSTLIVHVRGLDNPAALARTRAAGLLTMSQTDAAGQPVVVVDERTGARQLIWTELDPAGAAPRNTDLVIHPGDSFTEGDTYVVALRSLRTAAGRPIAAPAWFARLRDGRTLPLAEHSQRARYRRIFAVLARAGIARRGLDEAWDFTVGSSSSLTARMMDIRDGAFAQLGDTTMDDGTVQGSAPAYTIQSTGTGTGTGTVAPDVRTVEGTFQVPCYLVTCGASAGDRFHYSSRATDALPTQIPGNVATAGFACVIPSSATPTSPARISLYGDGFLGSYLNVERPNIQALAAGHDIVLCSTDQWGLALGDVGYDVSAMGNLNRFPAMVDRMQQGVLNMLFLGRLLDNPQGFAANPAFQTGGQPLIDTTHLYYDGNSTGGIQGGIVTAVSPDVQRAVLGVTGIDWANLLIPRTSGIGTFGVEVSAAYPDASLQPVVLDLMQQLWDRGDPDGYAQHMTTDPLPDTPPHTVLMQIAYGDKEVPMYAAAVEARTVGADAHQPALYLATNRYRDRNLFYGLPALPPAPFTGSAISIWDLGPGLVSPPPVASVPGPISDAAPLADPHNIVSYTPAALDQISDFMGPAGTVVDVCGGQPCQLYGYTP